MQPRSWPVLALTLLLLGVAVAGCTTPSDDNGNDSEPPVDPGEPKPPLWENPFSFELHFDGERAYQDLLAQIYEDPENHEGPRYRIPGTPTHTELALELHAKLIEPMDAIGGSVAFQNFTGVEYYELDLGPVDITMAMCDEEAPADHPDYELARDRVRDLEFVNIVARTNATHHGMIIAAHWDTKRFADGDNERPRDPVLGADDGASGTAAVLELARAFATLEVDLPLTFLLFDGEDGFDRRDCHPLAGSLYYAQALSEEEKDTIEGLILLDMVGNETAKYPREPHSYHGYPYGDTDAHNAAWLVDHIWSTAFAMNVTAFLNSTSTRPISDDHIPFLHEQIDAIDIINAGPHHRWFPPYWHTTRDDHTAVDPNGLEQVGVVVEAAIRLLDDPDASMPDATAGDAGDGDG